MNRVGLEKGIIDIEKIVIYKPILLRDLKNKINILLAESDDEDRQLVIT